MSLEQIFQRNVGNSGRNEDDDNNEKSFELAKIMLNEVMNHTLPSEKTMDLIEGLTKNVDRLVHVTEEYVKQTNEFVQIMKKKEGL